jgi:hypothetical protein
MCERSRLIYAGCARCVVLCTCVCVCQGLCVCGCAFVIVCNIESAWMSNDARVCTWGCRELDGLRRVCVRV